jgi:hypothetical protein
LIYHKTPRTPAASSKQVSSIPIPFAPAIAQPWAAAGAVFLSVTVHDPAPCFSVRPLQNSHQTLFEVKLWHSPAPFSHGATLGEPKPEVPKAEARSYSPEQGTAAIAQEFQLA